MKDVFLRLRRQKFHCFSVSYQSGFNSFILHHIISNSQHPLYTIRKRKYIERERAFRDHPDLFWHAIAPNNCSKTKVVRTWARRRLRNAFVEELRERGINQDGTLENAERVTKYSDTLGKFMKDGKALRLKGSLRLLALPPVLSTKYVDVRKETGRVADILLQCLEDDCISSKNAPHAQKMDSGKSQKTNVPLVHIRRIVTLPQRSRKKLPTLE
ncbi:hypothetical protein CC78DRAFT_275041 [Lojkania enalia]|uniref:Uncharacterized protein n=1 Tax=Lojkania enalia TaxID=147567 RepID=A0A9P4N2I3_9PLEO|nr:hypothetical protein CC78DRAFT_275041 [Didymosphaeria enalia]